MSNHDYQTLAPEYQKLWDTMHIVRDMNELQRVSDKIKKYKDVYQKVEKTTGVPWQMVAVTHLREAGESDIGVWKGVLHNGEKIVGTDHKTHLVPSGRGPFLTWQSAAEDALRQKGFDKIKGWTVSRVLWALEPYNGYGYRNKGLRSPYLWASTNHQQPGKYVADGVFDGSVMDTQIGCAALLKYLDYGVNLRGVGSAGAIAAGSLFAYMSDPKMWVGIGIGVAVIVLADIAWAIYKKMKESKNVELPEQVESNVGTA